MYYSRELRDPDPLIRSEAEQRPPVDVPSEYVMYRKVQRWAGDGPLYIVQGGWLDQPALFMAQMLQCQLAEEDYDKEQIAMALFNKQLEAKHNGRSEQHNPFQRSR